MVMSYQEAREYEAELQEQFGEDAVEADVTGGLPEHPEEFDLQESKEAFQEQLGEDEDKEYDGPEPWGDPWIRVEADVLHEVVEYLKTEPEHDFQSLHNLGGDHLSDEGKLVSVYHLYSLSNQKWIILKVFVPEDEPVVPSVTDLYRTADWHERESYEMLGIRYDGHPDLRRLLLPEDWEGYPLRKDYEFPRYYRGLPVDWDEARQARMSRDDFYSESDELEEMTDIDQELRFPDENGA